MQCYNCGGWQFMKPLCPGIAGTKDSRIMKRCRCNDPSMKKAAYAFAWIGYIVAVSNKESAALPED